MCDKWKLLTLDSQPFSHIKNLRILGKSSYRCHLIFLRSIFFILVYLISLPQQLINTLKPRISELYLFLIVLCSCTVLLQTTLTHPGENVPSAMFWPMWKNENILDVCYWSLRNNRKKGEAEAVVGEIMLRIFPNWQSISVYRFKKFYKPKACQIQVKTHLET